MAILGDGPMTIVPPFLQKPFRRLELSAGLFCVALGGYLLVKLVLLGTGTSAQLAIQARGDAVLALIQSVYLIFFGLKVLNTGHVGLVFWMIALALLGSVTVTMGWVG